MILHHTTTAANLNGILRHGMLVSKARGKIRAIWLHTEEASSWALQHIMHRDGTRLEDMVRVCVDVPRSKLRRFRGGYYYYLGNVRVDQIVSVTTYEVRTHCLPRVEGIVR